MDLSENDEMGLQGARVLATAIRSGLGRQLEELRLFGTGIGCQGFREVLHALRDSACAASLARLDVSSCQIGSEGVCYLCRLIEGQTFPRLQALNIGNDLRFSEPGMMCLVKTLGRAGSELTELNLSGLRLGNDGVAALAEILASGACPKLERVDLLDGFITAQGKGVLKEAVEARSGEVKLEIRWP